MCFTMVELHAVSAANRLLASPAGHYELALSFFTLVFAPTLINVDQVLQKNKLFAWQLDLINNSKMMFCKLKEQFQTQQSNTHLDILQFLTKVYESMIWFH